MKVFTRKMFVISTVLFMLAMICNGCSSNNKIEKLSIDTQKALEILDSISLKSNKVNLNPDSKQFVAFLNLNKIASKDELSNIIMHHSSSIIKVYAYISMLIREDKNADKLIKKYFNQKVNILIGDEGNICVTYLDVINFVNKRKSLLKKYIENDMVNPVKDDANVINLENKIRDEQGVPPR